MLAELLKSFFGQENIKYVRDSFFKKVEKWLHYGPKDLTKDTSLKANKILNDAEIEKQKEWINEVLRKRELEIEKTRPPKDIRNAKEEFRLKMYQATMNRNKEKEHCNENVFLRK